MRLVRLVRGLGAAWVAVACDHGWSSGAPLVRADPRYKFSQFLIPPTYHVAMISKFWVNSG